MMPVMVGLSAAASFIAALFLLRMEREGSMMPEYLRERLRRMPCFTVAAATGCRAEAATRLRRISMSTSLPTCTNL